MYIATINATTGELTAIKPGQIRIIARCTGARYPYSQTVTIYENLKGTYFFKNVELKNYMQLDDGGGNIFELWDFDGEKDQRWELIYVSNGYYKIQSVSTGKVATSPDDLNNPVWQDDYNGRDNQLWKITDAGNGQYKFSPKKYPSYYMAAGDGVGSNGRNVEMRANRSDHKDEWILKSINCSLPTPLIGQKTASWCWVASAEMLARTNHPTAANIGDANTIEQEQRNAVYHVFGDGTSTAATYDWNTDPQGLKNKGGIYKDVANASAYLVGLTNGDETFSGYATPYSEAELLHFLIDGHAVARLYGWATVTKTPPTTPQDIIPTLSTLDYNIGGHVTVIVGAEWSSEKQCYIYTVNDPGGGGRVLNYTYNELLSNSQRIKDGYEVSFWFPTVVTKTEYSSKTFLENILGEDYASR